MSAFDPTRVGHKNAQDPQHLDSDQVCDPHGADIVEEASEESFPASDAPAWTPVTAIGPPAHAERQDRHQATSRQRRTEHDGLLAAVSHLEAVVTAASTERGQAWHVQVLDDLHEAREALAHHFATAESAESPHAEIDPTRHGLTRRAERLRREHAELLERANDLERQVERGAIGRPNFIDFRQRAEGLLGALRRHQELEDDLIFETYCTDIGAGD
jgi:hypothetical protein